MLVPSSIPGDSPSKAPLTNHSLSRGRETTRSFGAVVRGRICHSSSSWPSPVPSLSLADSSRNVYCHSAYFTTINSRHQQKRAPIEHYGQNVWYANQELRQLVQQNSKRNKKPNSRSQSRSICQIHRTCVFL
jgi:hypothetical protein